MSADFDKLPHPDVGASLVIAITIIMIVIHLIVIIIVIIIIMIVIMLALTAYSPPNHPPPPHSQLLNSSGQDNLFNFQRIGLCVQQIYPATKKDGYHTNTSCHIYLLLYRHDEKKNGSKRRQKPFLQQATLNPPESEP